MIKTNERAVFFHKNADFQAKKGPAQGQPFG